MLTFFKTYRKLRGGKWYKVAIHFDGLGLFFYYSRTKPNKMNHYVIKKYRY